MFESVRTFVVEKFGRIVRFALTDPSAFIFAFITYVGPLLMICAVLAWKLQKAIEREQRAEQRRERISKKMEQKQKKKVQ